MKAKSNGLISQNKSFAIVAFVTAAILSIPLIAMQFSEEWDWKPFDFIVIGSLIFGTGSLYVFVARRFNTKKDRLILGIVFLTALLLIWAELAVGVIGTPFAGS